MSGKSKCARRSMPVSQWPEMDQAGWRRALQPQDLLDNSIGYASRWKPSTCKSIEDGYGQWLDWLARSGQLAGADDPAARVTHDRVRAYQQGMEADELAPFTIASRVQCLGSAMRAIAPAGDWTWLLRGASRLRSRAAPVCDKQEGMQSGQDVLQLGLDLMHAAEHDRFRTTLDRAVLFRDGLLLAMLVSRPLRRANVTSLEIGTQMQRRGAHWWLVFESVAMKSKRRFECSLPEELTPWLDRFIEVHRPALIACTRKALPLSNALWMSKQGTPMTGSAVAYQVRARTEEEFDKPISPHAFRRIYATDTATMDPAHVTDIPLGLGHATQQVSEKHYNLAKMIDAGNKYQATLAELRKAGCSKRDRQ